MRNGFALAAPFCPLLTTFITHHRSESFKANRILPKFPSIFQLEVGKTDFGFSFPFSFISLRICLTFDELKCKNISTGFYFPNCAISPFIILSFEVVLPGGKSNGPSFSARSSQNLVSHLLPQLQYRSTIVSPFDTEWSESCDETYLSLREIVHGLSHFRFRHDSKGLEITIRLLGCRGSYKRNYGTWMANPSLSRKV
jgi:hypothetical protein